MKIVKLKGGLGNQMFQYAFAKMLKKVTNDEVKIDLSPYAELNGDMVRKPRILKFNISLPIASKEDINKICKFNHSGNSQSFKYRLKIIFENLVNKKYLFEKNHEGYTNNKMNYFDYFDGYWQDWQMIDAIIGELKNDFNYLGSLSSTSKELMRYIVSSNSVSIGVRRGDYLTDNPKHYGVIGQKYYDQAMKKISENVKRPIFFIFSNDINWVKQNMTFSNLNIVYVTGTNDDFEDFVLLSKCKHSIIPNSTYHWWGARLNEYKGKRIIAPKKWFADDAPINILPERWEKI